jgi:hypothetical protein
VEPEVIGVARRGAAAVAAELRKIYTASPAEAAFDALAAFTESPWGRSTPGRPRTTNSIESLNYQLRQVTKARGHFSGDDAVVKLLWLAIINIEDKRAREREARRRETGKRSDQPAHLPEPCREGSRTRSRSGRPPHRQPRDPPCDDRAHEPPPLGPCQWRRSPRNHRRGPVPAAVIDARGPTADSPRPMGRPRVAWHPRVIAPCSQEDLPPLFPLPALQRHGLQPPRCPPGFGSWTGWRGHRRLYLPA